MTAQFRAIGGNVVADHGVIPLADARALARTYAAEALVPPLHAHWSRRATERSADLFSAVESARCWRRAAGWADPDEADQA